MYNCENNFLDNPDNRRLFFVLNKNLPWYLGENKNLLYHSLVFDYKPVSTFYDLLEPIRKKIKKEINQATFFMLRYGENNFKTIDNSDNKWGESDFTKLIYHINTSDGYTEISSQEKIPYTQNRSIIIDNQISTCEFSPVKSSLSLLLMMLFKK